MRSTISAFVLVLIFCSAPAAARNCTSQERADANAQLEAIEADKGTRPSILTKHLPFGVHRSTQGQNEQLMYQGGTVKLMNSATGKCDSLDFHSGKKERNQGGPVKLRKKRGLQRLWLVRLVAIIGRYDPSVLYTIVSRIG